jgi:tRNA(fMet)-specific endonuclease VapC
VSYLVDSDWLIDALVGVPAAVTLLARLRSEGLAVSIISYGELFEGAIGAPAPEVELANVRTLVARFPIAPHSPPIMETFARTRAALRRAGRLIPDLDLLIAATAIHHDLTLVTRNVRHFERIPDLTLYQPGSVVHPERP